MWFRVQLIYVTSDLYTVSVGLWMSTANIRFILRRWKWTEPPNVLLKNNYKFFVFYKSLWRRKYSGTMKECCMKCFAKGKIETDPPVTSCHQTVIICLFISQMDYPKLPKGFVWRGGCRSGSGGRSRILIGRLSNISIDSSREQFLDLDERSLTFITNWD